MQPKLILLDKRKAKYISKISLLEGCFYDRYMEPRKVIFMINTGMQRYILTDKFPTECQKSFSASQHYHQGKLCE